MGLQRTQQTDQRGWKHLTDRVLILRLDRGQEGQGREMGGGVCLAVNGARSLPALSREARDYLSSSN